MAKAFAKQFYGSKRWKAVRAEVLRRDLFTCQECGLRAQEVHHVIELTPDNINNESIALNPGNLRCLCHDCHTKITKGCDGDVASGYYFDENGMVIEASPH